MIQYEAKRRSIRAALDVQPTALSLDQQRRVTGRHIAPIGRTVRDYIHREQRWRHAIEAAGPKLAPPREHLVRVQAMLSGNAGDRGTL